MESTDRDVDERSLFRASVTEPVVRRFQRQFLIVSGRIVLFDPYTVGHHLCTPTTQFHTSIVQQFPLVPLTVKRPAIFIVIARAASLGHCPQHRRANYKILLRDVNIQIIFIMIVLILQNLKGLFNILASELFFKILEHPVYKM